MQSTIKKVMLVLVAVGGVQVVGCQSLIPTVTVTVGLDENLSSIDVVAGEANTKQGRVLFSSDGNFSIGRGSLVIDPEALSFTASSTNAPKLISAQSMSDTIQVTAFVASPELLDTVCEVGEKYGPYTVTLDGTFQPTSVTPASITLTQDTIDLLNAGSFSLCLQVDSSVSGTVVLSSLNLNLGF